MHPSKPIRYALFALLYFAQGAVLAYFTALNAIYLLSFGLSMGQIGLISGISMIPFVLKIFLGMLSDRVNFFGLGFRRPYILIGLGIQAICLIIVPFINPATHFWLYGLVALILMSGMALYDTCTDGLALDSTPKEEEGIIQGFMVGGRAMGVVLISSVIGVLAQNISWSAAFWTLAVLTIVPIPLVLMVKEVPRSADAKFTWDAFSAFKNKSVISLGLLGALYSLVINAANQIVNPYLQDSFGISIVFAGFFTTVWGIGVVIGSVTGGRLTDKIGHRKAVNGAILVTVVTVIALGFIYDIWVAWPLVALFGLAFGYYETVYFALSMEKTDPRIAASMFSILMAVANIGTGIGLWLSGTLVDAFGYQLTFVIIGCLNLLALPLLPAIFGKREKQVAASTTNS